MNYYAVERSPYLEHYGVKGMKWGVRRYQNKDGTWTEEGKRHRYSKFKTAENDVKAKATNRVEDFIEELTDLGVIEKRGKLSVKEATVCRDLAKNIFDNAKKIEPTITKDVVGAVKNCGATMYGLEHRLKQPSSLAAKIGSDAKDDGVSFAKASKSINDAIRYTAISDPNDYVKNYHSIKSSLESLGYSEVKCKNYFDLYEKGKVMHKAVQSTFEDKNGNKFELQFQTPASQAAKELKIPIYEERRQLGIDENRARELEGQMRDLAERVKTPKGVLSIKSH